MKICPKCDKTFEAGWQVCGKCGEGLLEKKKPKAVFIAKLTFYLLLCLNALISISSYSIFHSQRPLPDNPMIRKIILIFSRTGFCILGFASLLVVMFLSIYEIRKDMPEHLKMRGGGMGR